MMDLDKMLAFCRKCKYLPENELKQLCDRICDILISESNIQPVSIKFLTQIFKQGRIIASASGGTVVGASERIFLNRNYPPL